MGIGGGGRMNKKSGVGTVRIIHLGKWEEERGGKKLEHDVGDRNKHYSIVHSLKSPKAYVVSHKFSSGKKWIRTVFRILFLFRLKIGKLQAEISHLSLPIWYIAFLLFPPHGVAIRRTEICDVRERRGEISLPGMSEKRKKGLSHTEKSGLFLFHPSFPFSSSFSTRALSTFLRGP